MDNSSFPHVENEKPGYFGITTKLSTLIPLQFFEIYFGTNRKWNGKFDDMKEFCVLPRYDMQEMYFEYVPRKTFRYYADFFKFKENRFYELMFV